MLVYYIPYARHKKHLKMTIIFIVLEWENLGEKKVVLGINGVTP